MALNMDGTPNMTVTRWRAMSSSTLSGSKAPVRTIVPPFMTMGRDTMLSAATWNSGAHTSATSSDARSVSTRTLTQFHVMLPWLSVAPLGRPVVPDV